ncbi:MAG: hypothetical protein ABI452_01950 [Candidatus Limnocylindrales bacterium]
MLARLPAVTRRAALLTLVLVALIVPGTARAADTFEFNILRNSCTSSGHDFNHGEILLKVKVKENGPSGANKFTLSTVAQHHKARRDTWVNEYSFDPVKVTFPDDANSYYHTRWFAYDPKDKREHRIVVLIKVWHNKHVLASKTLTSKSC